MLWEKKGCRMFMRTWTLRWRYCYNQSHFIQVFTMMQSHGQLLCFILLYISNSSVSALLVRHVFYSTDLMSAICFSHSFLMVHRYIYSRYFSVFLMLYQLYYSLPSLTLISSSRLYLSVATWVTPQSCNSPICIILSKCKTALLISLKQRTFLFNNRPQIVVFKYSSDYLGKDRRENDIVI